MIAAAVTMSVAACGGGDDSDDIPVATSASSSSASTSGNDVTDPNSPPSVDQLNEMLTTALNPAVPNSEKTLLVQNSQKDPKIFDKLVKAKEDNPGVKYQIKGPVTADGPNKAKVRVSVKLENQAPTSIDAQIVYDNGRWKLASSSVCPLITANGVTSAMCPTSATSGKRTATSTPN